LAISQLAFQEAAKEVLGVNKEGQENPQESGRHNVNGKLNGIHSKVKDQSGSNPASTPNGKRTKQATKVNLNMKSLPASFLNEASFVMASLLVSPQLNDKSLVRQNIQGILVELVRTKKINARTLLRGNGAPDFLTRVFSSMDTCKGKSKPKYSAVELAFDLLRFCKDVSETQMVATLHFFLSLESPNNFACFILDKKNHSGVNSGIAEACERYLTLVDMKKKEGDEDNEIKHLASKLTIASLSLYMKEIIGYSYLNGALLRRGMAQNLSGKELSIFLRLLPKLLASAGSSAESTRRLLSFSSAVCDSLRGLSPLSDEEASALAAVQTTTKREISITQALAPLQVVLRDLRATDDTTAEPSTEEIFNPSLVSQYQLERLVL